MAGLGLYGEFIWGFMAKKYQFKGHVSTTYSVYFDTHSNPEFEPDLGHDLGSYGTVVLQVWSV